MATAEEPPIFRVRRPIARKGVRLVSNIRGVVGIAVLTFGLGAARLFSKPHGASESERGRPTRSVPQTPATFGAIKLPSRLPASAEPEDRVERSVPSWPIGHRALPQPARLGAVEGWWTAGLAVTLCITGGGIALIRQLVPRRVCGFVRVVGRVSLSPRHALYVLRVGEQVLLIGTGPQGAPALISELDIPSETVLNHPEGANV
jgi:hypothetical protein